MWENVVFVGKEWKKVNYIDVWYGKFYINFFDIVIQCNKGFVYLLIDLNRNQVYIDQGLINYCFQVKFGMQCIFL